MRNYKIDILRGISILLVLLHHFNIPYKLKDTWLGFDFLGEAFAQSSQEMEIMASPCFCDFGF